jgi:hypothetical protein
VPFVLRDDVVAVIERDDLRERADSVIVAAAIAEGRAIVTENVGDLRPLVADAFRQMRS